MVSSLATLHRVNEAKERVAAPLVRTTVVNKTVSWFLKQPMASPMQPP